MGIHGLMKLITEECPEAVKEQELENYTGRRIAIDASMAMYQFLIAVRMGPAGGGAASMLTNEAGEVTSHIQGMFNRTIKMMTSGLRPVYVFDGKPPQLKGGELAKRLARREKAEADLEQARAAEVAEDVERFSKRLVKVTRQHNEECRELLRLMGVPCLIAPCEAEAQCAELAKKQKVYATATEDMDALTFQSPKLLRKLTFSQSSKDKQPILEIDFQAVLKGLELSYEQFVDLCILCGCDYCTTIKGIGPKTALKLIKQHKTLEKIISVLQAEKKHNIPADWFPQRIRKAQLEAEANEESGAEDEGGAQEDCKEEKEEEEEEEKEAMAAEGGEEKLLEAVHSVETADAGQVSAPETHDAPAVPNVSSEGTTGDAPTGASSDEGLPPPEEGLNEEDYELVPPLYAQARQLFVQSEVQNANEIELKWGEPDEEGLKAFLVDRMGFNVERVTSAIKKLKEAVGQKSQKRMDSFFAPVASSSSTAVKRKAPEPAKGKDAKKGMFRKK